MMRALLVNPPFYRLMGSHYNGLPLGIAYVAAAMNRAGHDAWLYNADFAAEDSYGSAYNLYRQSDCIHDRVAIDAPLIRECADSILAFEPDVVGYTCYTATIPVVANVSRRVAAARPKIWQIVGGPHVSLDDCVLRRFPDINTAVLGEGEDAILNITDMIGTPPSQRIPKRIRDVSALALPERKKFWGPSRPMTATEYALCDISSIVTARGCPWRCRYCASQFIWPQVIARSVASVLSEVTHLLAVRPGKEIHFVDDTFTFNAKRALAIMAGIVDLGVPVPWRCEARADTISVPIADAMATSGCRMVKIGIESGSDRILREMRKGETKDAMRAAVSLLHARGIAVTAYLMAGYPGETDDDLRQTIDFARELAADHYSVSMVTPYYGTPLYLDALASGLPLDQSPWECFFHQSSAMMLNHDLSPELLEELWALNG
jgi:anaerobic magnesium-protoporphyrin IX monomethyl ester cyclase